MNVQSTTYYIQLLLNKCTTSTHPVIDLHVLKFLLKSVDAKTTKSHATKQEMVFFEQCLLHLLLVKGAILPKSVRDTMKPLAFSINL